VADIVRVGEGDWITKQMHLRLFIAWAVGGTIMVATYLGAVVVENLSRELMVTCHNHPRTFELVKISSRIRSQKNRANLWS